MRTLAFENLILYLHVSSKTILYFSGGTMQGIYGAGVVTALEDANVYDRIEAVYSTSAGSLVAAYFLARQSRLGSAMMLEDLVHDFISPSKFILGMYDRMWHYYIRNTPRETWRNAIDIEYLFHAVRQTRRLDCDLLSNQSIPLYVKLINLQSRAIEYKDARGPNVLQWLRAAVDVMPYTTDIQTIDGIAYADAGIKQVIGLDTLTERHPDSHIMIILNSHRTRRLSHVVKNKLEGYFASITGDEDFAANFASAEYRLRSELARIENMPHVRLYAIPDAIPIRASTTDLSILQRTYEAGKACGKKIASNLR